MLLKGCSPRVRWVGAAFLLSLLLLPGALGALVARVHQEAVVGTEVCEVYTGQTATQMCVRRWHLEWRPSRHILRGSDDYQVEGRPN